MKLRKRGLLALGAAGAMAVAGTVGGVAAAPASASTHTLTVWLMTGEISAPVYGAVNAAFEKEYPGWNVNVEIQQWSGITTKLDTGLASSNPPDATEIGNTDVPEYAASGGLVNLSSVLHAINPRSSYWLKGLLAPAEVKGAVYGVPLLAGDRVVIYNEQMFQQAGIKTAPNSLSQLLADGARLKRTFAHRTGFSALYMPGQYWYAALPMIWDHGGNLARLSGGKWIGYLASPQSLAGLAEFKKVQNDLSSIASRTVNTNLPDQDAVLADGKAAMIVGGSWEVGAIEGYNKALTGHLGEFIFPSYKGGPAPVFLGGSDIAVAANSPNKVQAEAWIKLMASDKFQSMMVKQDGLLPNNTGLLPTSARANPVLKDFLLAAGRSDGTPATPGWAIVEGQNEIDNLFSNVATAKSMAAIRPIAMQYDHYFSSVLNQTP